MFHIWFTVYSKLIINCSVKQRSLSSANIFGNACNEARPVVETVARIRQSGICQSLVGSSAPCIVVAQHQPLAKFNPEVIENKFRFDIALKGMYHNFSGNAYFTSNLYN